jgi:hypothetical protein
MNNRRAARLVLQFVLLTASSTALVRAQEPVQAPPPQPFTPPAIGMEGRRAGFFALGTGIGLSGTVMLDGVGTIGNQPAVFVEQSYGHHYSDPLRITFGASWGLDYNKEAFATFSYGKLNATERTVGSVGGYPLLTQFSSARAVDLEGGLRYYLQPEATWRTYLIGVIGLRFLQETNATLRVVEIGLTVSDVNYFDGSTLFIFGGGAGVSRDVSERLTVGAEIGLRFQPKPNPEDFSFGSGFQGINDTGSRWSMPITGLVGWRF